MAIKTGIGVGAAQIADTSNIMNAYARRIAQQQRADAILAERQAKEATALAERREKEDARYNEELADLIAGVKTEGARDEDLPDITNSYNEIKELYRNGTSIKDPAQKAMFRAELGKNIKSLNEYAQRSNKFSKDLYAIGSDIAKNEWDYDPASVSYLNKIKRLSLKDLGQESILDPDKFKRVPNVKLLDDIFSNVNKLGEKNAQYSSEEKIGADKYRDVSVADKVYIQKNLIQGVMNSPEAYSSAKRIFVNENPGQQPTDQALTEFLTKKYEEKYPYIYKSDVKKQPKAEKQDNEDVYAGWITGAFSKNNAESIKNLKSVAGQKVDIIDNKDGTFEIKYKPMIDVGKGGVPVYIESPIPKTDKATNPGELAGILRDAGVTGAGSKLISKVGGSYRPTTQPQKTTQPISGKVTDSEFESMLKRAKALRR